MPYKVRVDYNNSDQECKPQIYVIITVVEIPDKLTPRVLKYIPSKFTKKIETARKKQLSLGPFSNLNDANIETDTILREARQYVRLLEVNAMPPSRVVVL